MRSLRALVFTIALSGASGLALAIPMDFDVDALANSSTGGIGLDTGIFFNAGEVFTVFVDPDDLWNAGDLPRWSNADGLRVDLFATGSDESGEAAGTLIGRDFGNHPQANLTVPFGSLVGRVGGGDFFLIGTSFLGPAPDTGTLELFYWDSFAPDNTQFITATVTPVPEPGSVALIALGGLVLFFKRRLG